MEQRFSSPVSRVGRASMRTTGGWTDCGWLGLMTATIATAAMTPARAATPAIFALREEDCDMGSSVAHEPLKARAAFGFLGRLTGRLERLRAPLSRNDCGHVRELLRLQREKLVPGLRCLQRARGRLAG